MDRGRMTISFRPQPNNPRNSECALMRLKDNSILLMYNQYKGDSNSDLAPDDIVARYSYDEGETWSDARVVFSPEDFNTVNVGSPSIVRLLNGELGVQFNVPVKSFDKFWTRKKMFARSKDEGQTFYSIVDCTAEQFEGRHGINNARMKRLTSGRLIYPNSIHPGAGKAWDPTKRTPSPTSHTCGNFVYSDDDGRTWKTSKDTVYMPFSQSNPGLQEGEVIEIQPGVLKCFFRTDKMYQYVSISFDNGDHWTVPQPSCFTSICSPITIRKNPYSGKIYALWNPVPDYNGRPKKKGLNNRTPLAIAEVNADVSQIIKMEYVHTDITQAYCYVADLFLNEKELLIGFSNGRGEDGERCMDTLSISKVDLDF